MSGINNIQELGTAFEAFKGYHAKSLDEKIGKTEATLKEELAKASEATLAQYDRAKAQYEAMQKSLDDLSTKMNRVGNSDFDAKNESEIAKQAELFNLTKLSRWGALNGDSMGSKSVDKEEFRAYHKAFVKAMRLPDTQLGVDVQKALAVGSDPDGGAWIAPPTVASAITTRVYETSPMRELATVQTIGTESLDIMQDPNELDAGWVSETGIRNDTGTPTIVMKKITAYEMYAQPKATQKFLEDSNIDPEAWLAKKVADKFSRVENKAFLLGNGAEQPRGILTYPAGSGTTLDPSNTTANKWGEIEQVGSGQSGAFTYGGLVRLGTSLKEPFQDNAKFLIKRGSVASIMLLTDANGRLIFQPLLSTQFNNTPLLGKEIRYFADMPGIGAGAIAMAYGDFRQGYVIVDRVGISVIRDNLTNKPFVKFYTRKRVGGDVDNYDAIKLHILQ